MLKILGAPLAPSRQFVQLSVIIVPLGTWIAIARYDLFDIDRLGGQIYDYWKDPWGRIHEHWADSDLLNTEYEATIQNGDGARDYWGPNQQPTISYAIQKWNLTTLSNVASLIADAVKEKLAKGKDVQEGTLRSLTSILFERSRRWQSAEAPDCPDRLSLSLR